MASDWSPTMVTPDGEEIEPGDDYAGDHRPDPGLPVWEQEGNHPASKWPDVRRALIALDGAALTSDVAHRAGVSDSTAAKWLGRAHDQGIIEPTRDVVRPRNGSDRWRVGDLDAADIPEVLE